MIWGGLAVILRGPDHISRGPAFTALSQFRTAAHPEGADLYGKSVLQQIEG